MAKQLTDETAWLASEERLVNALAALLAARELPVAVALGVTASEDPESLAGLREVACLIQRRIYALSEVVAAIQRGWDPATDDVRAVLSVSEPVRPTPGATPVLVQGRGWTIHDREKK